MGKYLNWLKEQQDNLKDLEKKSEEATKKTEVAANKAEEELKKPVGEQEVQPKDFSKVQKAKEDASANAKQQALQKQEELSKEATQKKEAVKDIEGVKEEVSIISFYLDFVQEVAPPGWEGTVKKMKKKKGITNPWALAWSMKKKGYKPHYTKSGKKK